MVTAARRIVVDEIAIGPRGQAEVRLVGWPAINRILTPLELAPDARALCDEAWTAFRREMALAPRGRDPTSALTPAWPGSAVATTSLRRSDEVHCLVG
jgi:hypothetical protein